MHAKEAGLVAVEQVQVGLGVGVAEGGRDAAEVTVGLLVHGGIQEVALDGHGAALAPVGGNHFLDEAQFDIVEGAEAGDVHLEEGLEELAIFGLQDHAAGEQAVADSVLGRAGLACWSFGAAGAGAVGAGREDPLFRNHRMTGVLSTKGARGAE